MFNVFQMKNEKVYAYRDRIHKQQHGLQTWIDRLGRTKMKHDLVDHNIQKILQHSVSERQNLVI